MISNAVSGDQAFGSESNSRRLPKTIKIVGEKTMRWRLIFVGGAKKLASGIVDDVRGNPEWNCEVEITAKNPVDPIVIQVEDAKRRQVGQVIINLQEIPRRPIPELYETHLIEAKLVPTKKNPTPKGYIYYWIGTVDYWPQNVDTNPSLYKSKSLRKSLSSIGSAIFRTGKGDKDEGASNLSSMSKFKKLREKYRKPQRESSFVGSQLDSETNHSRSNLGPSLSRNSSVTSMSKGGWPNHAGATVISSQEGHSYNPINMDSDSDVDQPRQVNKIKLKSSTSVYGLENSHLAHEKNGGFLKKVKSKLSRSTQNLSEIGTKLKSQTNSKSSVVDETSVVNGRSRVESPHSRGHSASSNPFGGSESDVDDEANNPFANTNFTVVDGQAGQQNGAASKTLPPPQIQMTAGSNMESPFTIRSGPKQIANGTPSTRTNTHKRMMSGASDLFDLMGSNGDAALSPQTDGRWGLHPEERSAKSKPLESMNRSEMVNKIQALEAQNQKMREELIQLSNEKDSVTREFESASAELATVRHQLGALRMRLLKDNQTQYLEVEPNSEEDEHERSLRADLHSTNGTSAAAANQPLQTFSNPLRALANAKEEDHFNWW